uniref:Tryptophan/tyrosine permease n=1 Tax=Lactuca sativa TaxID=4236 RepID=A0A9R1WAU2_LACSA|nr:hypothetical protein LSAT_V11C200092060 [Lactuca sativa]
MKIQYIPSSSYFHQIKPNPHKNPKTNPSWTSRFHQTRNSTPFCSYRSNTSYYYAYTTCQLQGEDSQFKRISKKQSKGDDPSPSLPITVSGRKKGSVAGAVALIIGTSIGSGILALPQKTSPAGLIPSSISLSLCWGFLLIEALLLVEINVGLLKKKKNVVKNENELEVISIRTMAQETLGELGGTIATLTYVFLGYTSMIAYASKSGEILHHLVRIPESVSGVFFTMLFAILISIGGTRTTDQVNQVLTISMIGLLVAIEVLAILFGGWSGFEGNGDWTKVPSTIPVMIFSLVYHDLAPVLCAYLDGDIDRIRTSVILGSIVPLVGLLVWNAIALGLSSQTEPLIDPVELLMRQKWDGVEVMVEAFSLLAVGTSIIGTLLSFSQFFKEQIKSRTKLSWLVGKWWKNNRTGFTATAMVVAPSLFVSTTVPDGGYCMTMLYGVLPPAMAWAMHDDDDDDDDKGISRTRPVILAIGLFACGFIMEQMFIDLSIWWNHSV